MKISVLQEDLLWAITLAARFVSNRPQLPILANILLKTEEGKLKISATNLETGISLSSAAKIEKDGELTVPAKILVDLIANLPAGKIDIQEEKDNLIISTSSFSARIAGIASSEFPSVPKTIKEKHFNLPRETLSFLTKQVCFQSGNRPWRVALLTCEIHLLQQQGPNR
jgi:DNA polymerase-3 subunit beta